MEKIRLPPARIQERLAERAKYRLSQDSEWYYFQTRCLDNDRRINEYFLDDTFKEIIPNPTGIELKMYHNPDYYTVVMNDILEYHDREYTLEHNGIFVFCWEKAIILDLLGEFSKNDPRVKSFRSVSEHV